MISKRVVRITESGRKLAEVPVQALTDDAPLLERPLKVPPFLDMIQGLAVESIPVPKDFGEVLLALMGSPGIASKEWIYRQYDHMVGTNTVLVPGADAAILRVKGTRRGLAVSLDGNSRYGLANPFVGGGIAVAEAVRNVTCVGAKALGLTDCLNFASPEREETMWQFALCIDGITQACEELQIPVVSGNVSFYNETDGIGIYPTPVIGVVGLLEDLDRMITPGFKKAGDLVVLLGETREELGMTEYLSVVHHRERGFPPELDLEREAAVIACCAEAIKEGIIRSAHDCSEGGLAVALAESCLLNLATPLGAAVRLENSREIRTDAVLFGESQARIVVSLSPEGLDRLHAIANRHGAPVQVIGQVGGDRLEIRMGQHETLLEMPLEKIKAVWVRSIEKYFREGEPTAASAS